MPRMLKSVGTFSKFVLRPFLITLILIQLFFTIISNNYQLSQNNVMAAMRFTTEYEEVKVTLPDRLAIYYGYPSLVNNSAGNPRLAAATFAAYDLVVLGDGLEFDDIKQDRQPMGVGRQEHKLTKDIIRRTKRFSPTTQIFGYIDLGNTQKLSLKEIKERVDLWHSMGVNGIFLDEAGYDFGVTRNRQNQAIQYIHQNNLSAFLNAFQPEDLFDDRAIALNNVGGGNPEALANIIGEQDIFLLESFQLREGVCEDGFNPTSLAYQRMSHAMEYRKRSGCRVAVITTTNKDFVAAQFEYAWSSAFILGADIFGWGEINFSSSNNQLPLHKLSSRSWGRTFTSEISYEDGITSRHTNKGIISIDGKNCEVKFTTTPKTTGIRDQGFGVRGRIKSKE